MPDAENKQSMPEPASEALLMRMVGRHGGFTPLFQALMLAGLFATYPLALVMLPMSFLLNSSAGASLLFHVSIPFFFVISVTCLAYLLITPVQIQGAAQARQRYLFYGVTAGYVALTVLAALLFGTAQPFRVVRALGPVVIAAFFAVRTHDHRLRALVPILSVLWLVQITHSALSVMRGFEPIALAGNRNWAATLILVLTPWPMLWLMRQTKSRRLHDLPVWAGVAMLLILGVSTWFVYLGHCRATWLALALYAAALLLLWHCTWLGRILLLLAAAAVMAGAVIAYPEKAARTIEDDIRVPLYANTLRLISENPLLGVGPGNFRKAFVTYRSSAQSARAVAAPVTEHPHNELLYRAATSGIPAALLWAVVFCIPLLFRPGQNPVHRLAHFSLWLLVMHGMLDKVLVQPPTELLAALFAGMLWRPRLALAALPQRRAPALNRLRLPLAAVVALLSLAVCGREAWRGVLFRRAYLAEAKGQVYAAQGYDERARQAYEDAYAAYNAATRVAPGDVRTHAYAGICANNKLHDPERALAHIQDAMALERDFAHLNGEAGLALGSLNRHQEAFPFFVREAKLFPYSVQPLQRLFICASATSQTELLGPVHDRLMRLSVRRVRQRLGEQAAEETILQFRAALTAGDARAALAAANTLLEPLNSRSAADAPLYTRLDQDLVNAIRNNPFSLLDWQYWQTLKALRQRLELKSTDSPADLLPLLAPPSGGDAPPSRDLVRDLLILAQIHGFAGAYLEPQTPGNAVRYVQFLRGTSSWLADLREGTVQADTTLQDVLEPAPPTDATSGTGEETDRRGALMPSHPLQFFYRTQVLGALLSQKSGARSIPPAASPLVAATRMQVAILEDQRASGSTAAPVRIDYDPALFSDFQQMIERQLQTTQPRGSDEP